MVYFSYQSTAFRLCLSSSDPCCVFGVPYSPCRFNPSEFLSTEVHFSPRQGQSVQILPPCDLLSVPGLVVSLVRATRKEALSRLHVDGCCCASFISKYSYYIPSDVGLRFPSLNIIIQNVRILFPKRTVEGISPNQKRLFTKHRSHVGHFGYGIPPQRTYARLYRQRKVSRS